eukprot:6295457-Alexandrium_andersonii.AAC.1
MDSPKRKPRAPLVALSQVSLASSRPPQDQRVVDMQATPDRASSADGDSATAPDVDATTAAEGGLAS